MIKEFSSSNKKELRKNQRLIRDSIIGFEQKNELIFSGVKKFVEKFLIKNIFSYVSMQSEVDTKAIISYYISKNGFNVVVPCTNKEMTIHKLLSADKLETDRFGNIDKSSIQSDNFDGKLDLVLVPLLAFDKNLFRLGYGGGFYDRFLANVTPSTFALGLAFDEQEVESLPVEPHDVPLNAILTPTRLIHKDWL